MLDFLGLRRNLILLLIAIVVINGGEELWMRFLPKYLETLGASAFIIGLFDAIKTMLGALYAYPGGVVADRWGSRRALVAFTVISMAGYALVILLPHWAAVLTAMFLFLAWSNLSLPATFSMVGSNLPVGRHTMGIGVQSLIKRLPILVGPIAGGILIDRYGVVTGVRIAVSMSLVLGVLAIFIQNRVHEKPADFSKPRVDFRHLLRGFHPELRWLLLSDILIRFCERIPFAWVVIYAFDHVGLNAKQVGVLIAVEMLVAIACYIPTAHFADKYGREPFVIVTFIFFTLFPLTLLMAHSFGMLVFSYAVRGLKEFGDPARKALIIEYSPPETRGQTVGAYYLIRDTLVTLGSFLGVALWKLGPQVNFWTASAIGAAGTIFYVSTLAVVRKSPQNRAMLDR